MTDLVERLKELHADIREAQTEHLEWSTIDGRQDFLTEVATEIELLQVENERLNKQIASMNHAAHVYEGSLEDSRKRQELLEKVVDTNEIVMNYPDIREFLGSEISQIVDRARAALGDTKTQATPKSTASE